MAQTALGNSTNDQEIGGGVQVGGSADILRYPLEMLNGFEYDLHQYSWQKNIN